MVQLKLTITIITIPIIINKTLCGKCLYLAEVLKYNILHVESAGGREGAACIRQDGSAGGAGRISAAAMTRDWA